MRTFVRFVVPVMAAVALVLVAVNAASAGEAKPSKAAGRKTPPVYAVEQPLSGARAESILTDPRSIVTGTKQGSGWLLHYGTKRDTCARADATFGLRAVCVAW